jgi:phosphoethanolamine N-methyltransferase
VPEYGEIFKNLGFSKVVAEDKTDLFVESLKMELKRMADIKEEFVSEFTLEDFNYLVEGWEAKLVRCDAGHQRWGLFFCEK